MYDHICIAINDEDGSDCLGEISNHYHVCYWELNGEKLPYVSLQRETETGAVPVYDDHCCAGCGCRQGDDDDEPRPCEVDND